MSHHLPFDPYIMLGVAPDASLDDIKAAYRRVALRLHPDRNHNAGAALQLQDINDAHTLLLDPAARSAYDRAASERRKQPTSDFALRVTPSKRYVQPLDETQVIYLLAEIYSEEAAASPAEARTRAAQLNLTLLVDRSNSMNGTRLDRVKNATYQIIRSLTPKDIFSLVTFNDFAETVIEAAPVDNPQVLNARVGMITASGGTEILRGLRLGVEQNKRNFHSERVNHIILLTDGNTFGDQAESIKLAEDLAKQGIGISALGIGQDWNDEFLDQLASTTGGTTEYVQHIATVGRFLDDHVRSLASTFAERLTITIAPDPDVKIDTVFRLSPRPQPLSSSAAPIPLGNLQFHRLTSVLFQLELPEGLKEGFRSIARISVRGDIIDKGLRQHISVSDFSLAVQRESQTDTDEPPNNVMDALSKLTLYKMQERARQALERGDVQQATRTLRNLATRLMEAGEPELAAQANAEAQQVTFTNTLSEKGRKALKYQTRSLLLGSGSDDKKPGMS